MDPISLVLALFTAFGVISTDAVLHSNSVKVRLHVPAEVGTIIPKDEVLEDVFSARMAEICDVKSYFGKPKVQTSKAKTMGMVIAKALKVDELTPAIQHTFGIKTASVTGSFSVDNGKMQLLAVVSDVDALPETVVLNRLPGEDVASMVQRMALHSMENLAPYITALYHLKAASNTKDFTATDRLIAKELAGYASSAFDRERASFLNLAGNVALHKNDLKQAQLLFEEADKADPRLILPRINRAFVMLVNDQEDQVDALLEPVLTTLKFKRDFVAVAAAEMTRAAAFISLKQYAKAEAALADAAYWDPTSALVPALWSAVRREQGDEAGARKLREQARANVDGFETYPELASMYFRLSWKRGEPLRRNDLGNEFAAKATVADASKPK